MHTFREFVDLAEIERLRPSDYRGGKRTLDDFAFEVDGEVRGPAKPLPGHAGFGYRLVGPVSRGGDAPKLYVLLYDLQPSAHGYRDTTSRYTGDDRARRTFQPLIGALCVAPLMKVKHAGGTTPVYGVDAITVDDQPVYRGHGLGLALYLLLLKTRQVMVMAGPEQTPAGRAAWVRLAQTPGIQVDGAFTIEDEAFDDAPHGQATTADILFGTLGVEYLGQVVHDKSRMFTFPVRPADAGKSGQELTALAKHPWTQVYRRFGSSPPEDAPPDVTLLARAR